MRDYVTTVFNLIVGLIDADKIVYLALIGLGAVIVWQLVSLLTNFHRRFAGKCRKISKFLMQKGLSADNYNNFLALVAKMPQEFIRGYKTFEHASYGLPSDYIKRFDSIDVETNGGILNHGKSLIKAAIYGWTIVLFVLSLALLGNDAALTGFALADALIVPVLFLILAKIVYFIFNAIKQQQYKMAVDEFNEMLDIMNDKIENNDSLPGPDILTELIDSVPLTETALDNKADYTEDVPVVEKVFVNNQLVVDTQTEENEELETHEEDSVDIADIENTEDPENSEANQEFEQIDQENQEEDLTNIQSDIYTEEELIDEVENSLDQELSAAEELTEIIQQVDEAEQETTSDEQEVASSREIIEDLKIEETKEDEMEEKRGRGRPKKIAEGELVIKNDKQFEEVLQRAEKLMRKSEEALSGSQAKRVEKSLKELIDAMTKYKEEH